jgi:VCBS repeat-containing protein
METALMPRPTTQTITLSAAVANAVCASQTPGGAGALTINGANASGGVYTAPNSTPRHITITSGSNESAKTFTITGTDRNGRVISTTTTGPNATTKTITINFNTITGISIDAASVGAITVGFTTSADTAWIPLDRYSGPEIGLGAVLTSDAGMTFTLQTTNADLQASGFKETDATAISNSDFALNASLNRTVSLVASGIRFAITGWTLGTATFTVLQKS